MTDISFYKSILPAHAGMILKNEIASSDNSNITRTCGDDPNEYKKIRDEIKYYPHMRG